MIVSILIIMFVGIVFVVLSEVLFVFVKKVVDGLIVCLKVDYVKF